VPGNTKPWHHSVHVLLIPSTRDMGKCHVAWGSIAMPPVWLWRFYTGCLPPCSSWNTPAGCDGQHCATALRRCTQAKPRTGPRKSIDLARRAAADARRRAEQGSPHTRGGSGERPRRHSYDDGARLE
jgi:hypothetical protein